VERLETAQIAAARSRKRAISLQRGTLRNLRRRLGLTLL
jgi:hypothetical protein